MMSGERPVLVEREQDQAAVRALVCDFLSHHARVSEGNSFVPPLALDVTAVLSLLLAVFGPSLFVPEPDEPGPDRTSSISRSVSG